MNSAFAQDLALDLGTERIRIASREAILVDEPALAAMEEGKLVAVGEEARLLVEQNPAKRQPVQPIRYGAVRDAAVTGKVLRLLWKKAGLPALARRQVLAALPPCLTEVEQRAALEAVRLAGAAQVVPADAALLAAWGCGLELQAPRGQLAVDIGAGTVTAAAFTMGTRIAWRSAAWGADRWDGAIADALRKGSKLALSASAAREIKHQIAPWQEGESFPARGRVLETGVPVTVEVSPAQVAAALAPHLEALTEMITAVLAEMPPELAADVLREGIVLCGGGSLLKGLPGWLEERLSLPVRRAESPREAVIRGGMTQLEKGMTVLRREAGNQRGRRVRHG